MNGSTHPRHKHALLLSVFLGGVVLTSCEAGIENRVSAPQSSSGAMSTENAAATDTFADEVQNQSQLNSKASRPQLIKKAALTLVVNSLDKSIQQVSAIVRQQQGDLLGLEDQKSPTDSAHHTVLI